MTGIIFLGIGTIAIITRQIWAAVIQAQMDREDAEELANIPIQLTIWDLMEK